MAIGRTNLSNLRSRWDDHARVKFEILRSTQMSVRVFNEGSENICENVAGMVSWMFSMISHCARNSEFHRDINKPQHDSL